MSARMAIPVVASLLLGACATMPTGPAVTAMPGAGKSFDAFQQDNIACQQFAQATVGTTPNQAATDSAVGSSVLGSALGAAAGAIIGSASGQAGQGAAIGAGAGLLFGAAAGSNAAGASYYTVQRRYDGAYLQCMYAKGNRVPVRMSYGGPSGYAGPPPGYGTPYYAPPPTYSAPPAGYPPPGSLPPNYPPPNYPPPDTPPPKG